jgi:DnaK suppressor protein
MSTANRSEIEYCLHIELEHSGAIHGLRREVAIEGEADSLDQTFRASQRDLAALGLELTGQKRKELYAALNRLKDGSYGTCESCGEDISPKRLAAIPWASNCISCQQSKEISESVSSLASAA